MYVVKGMDIVAGDISLQMYYGCFLVDGGAATGHTGGCAFLTFRFAECRGSSTAAERGRRYAVRSKRLSVLVVTVFRHHCRHPERCHYLG
jgi:hypothetical protein